MIEHPRETLQRLRRAALEAPTADERKAALAELDARLDAHTRPTEPELQPVRWP